MQTVNIQLNIDNKLNKITKKAGNTPLHQAHKINNKNSIREIKGYTLHFHLVVIVTSYL